MDGIIHNNNRPRSKPINNILTKENYKMLVIAIGIGWEIQFEEYKKMFKLNPEWATQGEYLAYLWKNHNRVNPFFVKDLQKACDEKILSDNQVEFLKLKDLLSKFSRNQNRSRTIQNNNLLIEFDKLKEHIAILPHSVSNLNEIDKAAESLNSILNGIIQDWKENNNYMFFKNGKWHNRHHDTIADPTEFLSSDEIEAFENELEQTENQLKIFNGFRIEIDKHMSIIRNIAAQNSSTFSKSNFQEKKVEPIAQLKTNLTDTQRCLLFDLLVKGGFILDENKDCFIWAFGRPDETHPGFFRPVKWDESKALLAYFVDIFNFRVLENDGKEKRTQWKPFELIFDQSGLRGAKNDYQKTGTLPIRHKYIDKIINDILI